MSSKSHERIEPYPNTPLFLKSLSAQPAGTVSFERRIFANLFRTHLFRRSACLVHSDIRARIVRSAEVVINPKQSRSQFRSLMAQLFDHLRDLRVQFCTWWWDLPPKLCILDIETSEGSRFAVRVSRRLYEQYQDNNIHFLSVDYYTRPIDKVPIFYEIERLPGCTVKSVPLPVRRGWV